MQTKPPRNNYPHVITDEARDSLRELCARMTIEEGRRVAQPEAIATAIMEALANRRDLIPANRQTESR